MVQKAEDKFLRVFLLSIPVWWHYFPHIWLYHSDTRVSGRVCLLDIRDIGAVKAPTLLVAERRMRGISLTQLMERYRMRQTLHYGIKKARISSVFHPKCYPLIQIPNIRPRHQIVNIFSCTCFELAFEIGFILLSLATFNLKLLAASIWNHDRTALVPSRILIFGRCFRPVSILLRFLHHRPPSHKSHIGAKVLLPLIVITAGPATIIGKLVKWFVSSPHCLIYIGSFWNNI